MPVLNWPEGILAKTVLLELHVCANPWGGGDDDLLLTIAVYTMSEEHRECASIIFN